MRNKIIIALTILLTFFSLNFANASNSFIDSVVDKILERISSDDLLGAVTTDNGTKGLLFSYNDTNNEWEADENILVGGPTTSNGTKILTYAYDDASGEWTAWSPAAGSGLPSTAFSAVPPLTLATTSLTVEYGITQASSTADGYLSSEDWNTFNDKFGSLDDMPLAEGLIYVGNSSNNPEATSTIFIDSNGNVGIGSTSPSHKLTVDGAVSLKQFVLESGFTPSPELARSVYWNDDFYTLNIVTGLGPVLQIGQEEYVLVINNSGSLIENGSVVSPSLGTPVNELFPIQKAIADSHETIQVAVSVATMDIPDNSVGFVTTRGYVRDIDTSMFSLGQPVYISTTTPGGLTALRPQFPNYPIQIGGIASSSATNGTLSVTIMGDVRDTFNNVDNGTFREQFDFTVSSDGSTITGSLSPRNGQENMTMIFSDGFTTLDTTPAKTITLTPGTNSVPQLNYIYIPIETKVLTLSTTGYPEDTNEFIYVATLFLQDARSTQLYDSLVNQNINNEIQTIDGNGFKRIIADTVRFGTGWREGGGSEASVTVDTTPSPDDIWVSTTAGKIRQMHDQAVAAKDTETGDIVFVANDSVNPYATTSNLNVLTDDANGESMAGNTFSLVLWGVANSADEPNQIMINLPTSSYDVGFFPPVSQDDANNDIYGYAVKSIPSQFKGTGFLIARITFSLNGAATSWTLEGVEDLRGQQAGAVGGGGGSGTGVTSFTALSDTPSGYVGNSLDIVRVNSGETALEFVDDTSDFLTQYLLKAGGTMTGDVDFGGFDITNISDISVSNTTTFSTVTYDWPNADGSSGNVLTTDGLGNLSWTAAGAGDVTDVYNCTGGDCNMLTMDASEYLDATAGVLVLPVDVATTTKGGLNLDTTSDQIQYVGDSVDRALTPEPPKCIVVENLAATDDNFFFGSHGQAVTIESVWCQYSGTGTTVAQISLEDGAGNAMTHTTPVCTAIGTPPTAQAVTANNSLTATETLAFDVDNAVAPETDTYQICVQYTVTPD